MIRVTSMLTVRHDIIFRLRFLEIVFLLVLIFLEVCQLENLRCEENY